MSWESRMRETAMHCGIGFEIGKTTDGIVTFHFRKGDKYLKFASGIEAAFYWIEGYKDGLGATTLQPTENETEAPIS
jgi:hypothetical protein